MTESRRRLLSILSADAAGYSRLMRADDESAIASLDACRDVFEDRVEAHGGRIVDTAGDNVLAVFDSVVETVRAAVEIQEAIAEGQHQLPEDQRMRFRIGINLGDVIEKADGTVYGDGVNVAARLQALAEPGSIIISGTAYDEISDRVDVSFVYVGEKTVKNINRPVRAYRLSGEDEAAIGPVQVAALFRRNRITLSAAIALLVTVFLGMFLSSHSPWPRSDPVATVEADNLGLSDDTESTADDRILAMPAGPSIAVLPFDNLSDDPDQEYFGEALAENIITSLSRFTDLFVIARNSTFQYKNKPIDIRKVGDELGARYVLEGSIQKFETRIRITAQLIDAKTGNHVWAESYDRDLTVENILDLQDEIRDHIVAEIAGGYGVIAESVIKATKERRPQNLQAYICVLRAKDYYRVFSEEEHLKVRNCLETVMTPDSDYAVGWAWLGLIVLDEWRFNFNRRQDVEQPLDRAFEYARRAVALDPRSQDAQHALFKIHFFRKELDLFKIHVEKALLLNPNNVFTLSDAGFFLGFSGRWDKGVAIIRKAMDLNPNYPGWYHFLFFYDHYRKKEYDKALEHAQQINTPGLIYNHIVLTCVLGQLERAQDAKPSIKKILSMDPQFPVNVRSYWRKYNISEELIAHLVEGLRLAGLNVPDDASSARLENN